MGCKMMKDYRGNMSDKILIMINDIMRDKCKETVLKGVKQHYLSRLKKMLVLKKKKEELSKRIKEEAELIEKEVENKYDNISFNSYRWDDFEKDNDYPFNVNSKCWVNDEVKDELQESNKLWALGRKKEAKLIWDKLIAKYELVKQ